MRNRNYGWPLLQATVCAALVATAAQAQVPGWRFGSGAYLESYRLADEMATGTKSVSLLTVPFAASLRLASWAQVDVSGAFASAEAVRSDDSKSSISGLTDTAVQLSFPLLANRVVLAATLIAPTGNATISYDEAQIAGIVAADLLPFRISNWGSGGGVDLSTSVAAATGSVNLGARIGYQMAREYDLLDEGDVMYRPGNQLYVRFGADRSFGAARAAAQVTLYHFGKDVMNSQNLYQSGNRIHALLTFVTPFGRMGRAQVYASALQRQRGEFLDGAPSTPSQTVVTVGGGLRQPIGGVVFVPSVDVRLLRRSDGLDQGFMSSAGASLELPAGDVVTLLPSARVRYGTLLVSEGVETNITGFEVATALRFGRRQ